MRFVALFGCAALLAGCTKAEDRSVGAASTADTSGWTITGPDRKAIPVRVLAVAGDSVVTEAGPYGSFVLKGAQVTTRTVFRLEGDKLVGTTEARYKIGGRDSVAQRVNEGTRIR